MSASLEKDLVRQLFLKHKTCVVIPTYNNAQTIAQVVQEVLQYTQQVLVVNDGSTDNTLQLLQVFDTIELITYDQNKGKGYAIKCGLRKAIALGYDYAITIDSDGQHYPSDLHLFLQKLEVLKNNANYEPTNPALLHLKRTPATQVLMIGSRNLNQDNVPTKSNFGNRFSSFWYWVNTGIRLPDTQSGYRMYPLQHLGKWRYLTTKYEFEIEIIVRAAWAGIEVIQVPVSVYYPPPDERISHFRPLKDFTRISILNTFLVLTAFFFIHPRNLFIQLSSRKGWQKIVKALFLNTEESNQKKAASLGFGVFMGIVPVWGFQLAIGIPLAIFFRLNKVLFLLAANISIFPITAFWILASLATGKWLMHDNSWKDTFSTLSVEQVAKDGAAFLLGGSVLALFMGLFTYLLSFALLQIFRKK